MGRIVRPSEKTREEIHRLVREGVSAGDPSVGFTQLAIRQVIEEALEAAVRDLLGREPYERRTAGDQGYRNGNRAARLKTAEGQVTYSMPQVRDVSVELLQRLRKQLGNRTEALEKLAIEMYARGCSTRDVEDAFRDDSGQSMLSRTAVSEVTETLWKEYREFSERDLSETHPVYLFVDGIAESLRPGNPREAILCAWALNADGRKILLHLSPGTKESTDCCRDFLQDMKRRGLTDPIMVVTDGAPGLIRAVEECFPQSLRQRCLAHRMRNILSKLPDEIRKEFRQAVEASYHAPSPAMARAMRDDLVERYERDYPSAVHCFLEDFEACIAHLQCPPGHRRAIRTTNLLERLFLEERRRMNAARTLFGERPVLKLMYAALIRASGYWIRLGLSISSLERRQLEELKKQLAAREAERNAAPKFDGSGRQAPLRVSSKNRT